MKKARAYASHRNAKIFGKLSGTVSKNTLSLDY